MLFEKRATQLRLTMMCKNVVIVKVVGDNVVLCVKELLYV